MSRYESICPPKIKRGDRVGIAAPSSPFDRVEFEQGLSYLRAMGLDPIVPENIFMERTYLSGSDENRASVVNDLFEDPSIKAIICARGGYGSMRILDRIDGEVIRDNPKLFVGFSDVTALLNHLYQTLGLVCYHGPVVCSLDHSDQESRAALENLLFTGEVTELKAAGCRVLSGGKADGIVMGGNLATLCHLTGTSFQPDFRGAILMLEDVGEAPYKIDRMLTQMKYAGLFENVNAVVLGSFENCGDPDQRADIVMDVFGDYDIPLAMDFDFGHGRANRVFPIGSQAHLDTDSLTLAFD